MPRPKKTPTYDAELRRIASTMSQSWWPHLTQDKPINPHAQAKLDQVYVEHWQAHLDSDELDELRESRHDVSLAAYRQLVDSTFDSLSKLSHEQKVALRSAYIFASKVPEQERQDMFGELFLSLWESIQKLPTKVQLSERWAYVIARHNWVDWWRAYKVRQHYSLDQSLDQVDADSPVYGDLIPDTVDYIARAEGAIDGQALWQSLPTPIRKIVSKRLAGRALTGTERVRLHRFAREHAELLC